MSALRKVLVVDDDPVVGKSFNRVLSDKGYVVVTAEDGFDALIKLQSETYDVVFTDIRMPGMDGLEVAEQVRASQPWTPVVVVTGYGTAANEERARAAGVSDFLRKPLSPEMIENSAANALLPSGGDFAEAQREKAAAPAPAPVSASARPEAPVRESMLKNMALFLSAPFVGLLYAVLLPFIGLGMLGWFAVQALMDRAGTRSVLRFGSFALRLVAGPFIGLAFLIVLPFAAMGMLVWTGARAVATRVPAD
jgi:CheY-like chemotaxis protein